MYIYNNEFRLYVYDIYLFFDLILFTYHIYLKSYIYIYTSIINYHYIKVALSG